MTKGARFVVALTSLVLVAACSSGSGRGNADGPIFDYTLPPFSAAPATPLPPCPSFEGPIGPPKGRCTPASEGPIKFPPETEAPPETQTPTATVDPAIKAEVEALIDDTAGAAAVTDLFWKTHWSDFFTGTYKSPTVYGGYFGKDSPTCGGKTEDDSLNAYYCEPDDYLAWDWNLMLGSYTNDTIGDSFVYLVIAHEWGHAIQARLDRSLTSKSAELQADCMAGAVITGAVKDNTLTMEPGDRGEIFTSLASIADEVEWGDVASHGAADQRIEAYQQGEAGGVESCLPKQ